MKTLERQALARLIDEFGAEVTVSLKPYEPLETRYRKLLRVEAGWVRDFGADRLLTVVVAGDADRKQVGMIVAALGAAGLDRDDIHVIRVQGSRAETVNEIVAADSRYRLFAGAEALAVWRDRIQLRAVVGGVYPARLGGVARLTAVTYSPGAVLRGAVDLRRWREGVARFVDVMLHDDSDDVEHLTWGCSEWVHHDEATCAGRVVAWDRLGLPWCDKHLADGWDATVRVEAGQGKRENALNQQVLL